MKSLASELSVHIYSSGNHKMVTWDLQCKSGLCFVTEIDCFERVKIMVVEFAI